MDLLFRVILLSFILLVSTQATPMKRVKREIDEYTSANNNTSLDPGFIHFTFEEKQDDNGDFYIDKADINNNEALDIYRYDVVPRNDEKNSDLISLNEDVKDQYVILNGEHINNDDDINYDSIAEAEKNKSPFGEMLYFKPLDEQDTNKTNNDNDNANKTDDKVETTTDKSNVESNEDIEQEDSAEEIIDGDSNETETIKQASFVIVNNDETSNTESNDWDSNGDDAVQKNTTYVADSDDGDNNSESSGESGVEFNVEQDGDYAYQTGFFKK